MSSSTCTAFWFPVPDSALSTPVVTENGLPLCHRDQRRDLPVAQNRVHHRIGEQYVDWSAVR